MAIDIDRPFANSGDITNIPNDTQPNGSVSYEEGWGSQYEVDPASGGRRLEKNNFNGVFNLLTTNQKELVDQGVINHIVDKEYLINAKVRGTDGNNYTSNKTTVTAPPSADWDLDTISAGRDVATQGEAEAGINNENVITPLGLRYGLNATGTAPIYACRAWVNFDGTGPVAIRESGNVSSITDLGTGHYTINFFTAMEDTNYSPSGSWGLNVINIASRSLMYMQSMLLATSFSFYSVQTTSAVGSYIDAETVSIQIHR